MRPRPSRVILFAILLPVALAMLVRYAFGVSAWEEFLVVMLLSFLCGLPLGMGALCVWLSPLERARSKVYSVFISWVPVLLFFVLTLAASIEGWACWAMLLVPFLLLSTIGGLIGRWLKLRKRDGRLQVSLLVFLPFLMAPVERWIGSNPQTYEARTSIDIQAPSERIWPEVTRVRTIPQSQDRGWLTRILGFPRPVRAELDFNGVGGSREAVFTNGLVFHERVLEYEEGRKMVFSIKANPHEIPSATMDEHVVVGGKFFDVLTGTYELERLDATHCRLHLWSNFRMNTTFNFYASLWARWIMLDIQDNILQVERGRAEQRI